MYANSIHIIDYLRLFCRGDILEIESCYQMESGESAIYFGETALFVWGYRDL